jgi:arylsulfatase A-like enzyme
LPWTILMARLSTDPLRGPGGDTKTPEPVAGGAGSLLMTSPMALSEEIGTAAPGARTLRPHQVFVLSVWCGLVAGPLEVGAIVLRKHTVEPNQFYWMSRHFVWLIPVTNLLAFLVLGLLLAIVTLIWPRRGGGISARLLCALTALPLFWTLFPRVYGPAGFLLVLGIATWLAPALERRAAGFRRCVRWSIPVLAGFIALSGASVWAGGRLREWREAAQALPAPGSPNVLLIVLDTVAADHLSLHGYGRPTCPTLDDLARRGIRFERAQVTSSWTLPSHASFFTGRWPHELSASWFTPLDAAYPTLAEYLQSRGYATAGFVANLPYCGADTGLERGFTHYEDYIFPELSAFKPAVLVERTVEGLRAMNQVVWDYLGLEILTEWLQPFYAGNRKPATAINHEFLHWLSSRRQPERPFFAFLNFIDAHYPYKLPDSSVSRFGGKPRNEHEKDLIDNWQAWDKLRLSDRDLALVRDAYDDCIADLDEAIGCLIDRLERRGLLERTWLVVTSDHGESFGEPHNDFGHGTSLYQPQLHVPLVIVPPAGDRSGAGRPSPRVVPERVSLRDLPATIVDLLDLEAGAPFFGTSLARLWGGADPGDAAAAASGPSPALSEVVPTNTLTSPSEALRQDRSVWASLAEGDSVYIRASYRGDIFEELFDLRADPRESLNLAEDAARRPLLERMRATLDRLTAGPLTVQRFRP